MDARARKTRSCGAEPWDRDTSPRLRRRSCGARTDRHGPSGDRRGDGSLADVAGVAVERDLPFVCIPFGTRNHFARDLGLDRDDPIGALDAFEGVERRIDVGRVGDRLFLNNVSIGAYASSSTGRSTTAAGATRSRSCARCSCSPVTPAANSSQSTASRSTPGSLSWATTTTTSSSSRSGRERLDEGLLHVYLARGWRPSSWDEQTYERLTVDADQPRLRAAVDGEPTALETPLEFSIEPGRYASWFRQAESTSVMCPKASSATGTSSGANQRSSATSSAARGVPSAMRAL